MTINLFKISLFFRLPVRLWGWWVVGNEVTKILEGLLEYLKGSVILLRSEKGFYSWCLVLIF